MLRIWRNHAHRKTVVMTVIFLLICIVHTTLFNLKDALLVTTAGAETIPYIQLWFLLPITFVASAAIKNTILGQGLWQACYRLLGGFILFFIIFACVLHPCGDDLCPTAMSAYLTDVLPTGLEGAIAVIRHWPLTVLFLAGELWTSLVTAMIFWAIANEVTSLEESASCYPWVRVGGALGAVLGGIAPNLVNALHPVQSINWLMVIIIVLSIIAIVLLRYLITSVSNPAERQQLTTPLDRINADGTPQMKGAQWRVLFQSSYMICLALIVLGYNMAMNLFELVWKAKIHEVYPAFNDYNTILGYSSTACGVLILILALMTPSLLNRFGWTFTAMLTPAIQFVLIACFFGLLLGSNLQWLSPEIGALAAVWVGLVQYSVGRATKFSIFDITKDMAFIPLPSDVKASGKAAVEGVGSTGGRALAASLQQFLLLTAGGIGAGVPILSLITIGTIAVWLGAVQHLGKQFEAITKPTPAPVEAPEAASVIA